MVGDPADAYRRGPHLLGPRAIVSARHGRQSSACCRARLHPHHPRERRRCARHATGSERLRVGQPVGHELQPVVRHRAVRHRRLPSIRRANTNRLTVPAGLGGNYLVTASAYISRRRTRSTFASSSTARSSASGAGNERHQHGRTVHSGVVDLVAGDYVDRQRVHARRVSDVPRCRGRLRHVVLDGSHRRQRADRAGHRVPVRPRHLATLLPHRPRHRVLLRRHALAVVATEPDPTQAD